MRFCLAHLVVVVFALASGMTALPQTTTTPIDDPQIVVKLEKAIEGVDRHTTLRARFRQEKTTPLLRRPIKSSGEVLMRDSTSRWHTTEPHEMFMRVGLDDVRFYYPEDKLLEIYETPPEASALVFGPSVDLAALRESFALQADLSLQAQHDANRFLAVRLVPKDQSLRDVVGAHMSVLLDLQNHMIVEAVTQSDGGGTTRTIFEKIELDVPLDESELAIDTPADTTIERIANPGQQSQAPEANER